MIVLNIFIIVKITCIKSNECKMRDRKGYIGMKELNYPFEAEYIIKKKKSLKKQLLADTNQNFL